MEGATRLKREEVIRLILCQLSAYGYSSLSQAIATHTGVPMTADSNSRLEDLVTLGLQNEGRKGDGDRMATKQPVLEVPDYKMWYQTTHKGIATAAAFSRDGKYIATGSADTTLKVIEVDRLRSPSNEPAGPEEKPVIRTLYDHMDGVTGLAFHPNGLVLASCSADRTIKLFDLSVAHGKRAFRVIQDNFAFRSISFHPSGEYLAAGGDGHEVRLYDTRTSQGFLLPGGDGPDQARHSAGITQVRYASNGSLIVSSSSDGTAKIWDGVSGKCIRTLDAAHGGRPVTAAVFSRNAKYVLSTGLDSRACLWEVASGRLVNAYEGAGLDAMSSQAVFSHDESFVMAPDDRSNMVVCWDARTGELLKRTAHHHSQMTCVAHSPAAPAFISCSTDYKVRYWSPDTL
ncbi:cleavage stimulation factor, 3 [Martensiomyces pterosporus]|nr:cleavage stimulation factor, 3 [Martensiomyces pterosporus]